MGECLWLFFIYEVCSQILHNGDTQFTMVTKLEKDGKQRMDLAYRLLAEEEIDMELFGTFNRYQKVEKCWRKIDGKWELKDIAFTEQWEKKDIEFLVKCLRNTVAAGGRVIGVTAGEKLAGFASVESELLGSGKEYIQLSSIHVSYEHRGRQIGRNLFWHASIQARELGGRKLYISAHSSQETQAFYKALGCVEAKEYQAKMVEEEPCDCQLEYCLCGEARIRTAVKKDLDQIAWIEERCFPAGEAASRESLYRRFQAFPECFFVAEVNKTIVGDIQGAVIDSQVIADEMYHDESLHNPDGPYQSVFGIEVLPQYQHQKIAAKLMEELIRVSKERGKKGITLTCKDRLIPFYESFGYVHKGVSDSAHGGARWNDMLLEF